MDPTFQAQNESDYLQMINYLIDELNKKKGSNIPNQLHNKPIFLFEFFIFELYLPRELLRQMKQPLLAFRFLDFPTLTLSGNVIYNEEKIIFNQGKSSYFEMTVPELKENLIKKPMYIMFIDKNFGDMKIIGSSRLNISIFAYDSFLEYSGSTPKPRRNILKLFDNSLEKVAEFEISLLIRREYYKYEINTFPLNQEKIFVNNNAIKNVYGRENLNTCAKPYTNDLRMQNTDNIMKSDHIRMDMNEKTKKQLIDTLTQTNNQENKGVNTYTEINDDVNQLLNYKNDNNNEINDNNIQKENHPDDYWKGEKNVLSIMNLLNADNRNPPALYYTHNKPEKKKEETVIRIIHEEKNNKNKYDDNDSNYNKSKKKNETTFSQTENDFKLDEREKRERIKKKKNEPYSIKEKNYYPRKQKKMTDKEMINYMYNSTKEKYERDLKEGKVPQISFIPNNSRNLPINTYNMSMKRYKNEFNENIEEKQNENDEEEKNYNNEFDNNDNVNYEEIDDNNEYLKVYSQIKKSKENSALEPDVEEIKSYVDKELKESKTIPENINSQSNEYNDFENISSNINSKNKGSSNNFNNSTSTNNKKNIIPKKSVKKSVSSQKSGGTNSLINSVLESGNSNKRKKTISTIEENIEGYNDFNNDIDEEINDKNNKIIANQSQIIPEDNINKNINSTNSIQEDIKVNNNKNINSTNSIPEDIKTNKNKNINSTNSIPEDIKVNSNKNINSTNSIPEDISGNYNKNIGFSNSSIKESIPQNIKSTNSIPEDIPSEKNNNKGNKFSNISSNKFKESSIIGSKEIDEIIEED